MWRAASTPRIAAGALQAVARRQTAVIARPSSAHALTARVTAAPRTLVARFSTEAGAAAQTAAPAAAAASTTAATAAATETATATTTAVAKKLPIKARLLAWAHKNKLKFINCQAHACTCTQRAWFSDRTVSSYFSVTVPSPSLSSVSIAGGVTFGVYSVYALGFDLIDFFLEQREADAPYLAFFTGAACTLTSAALYRVTRRAYALSARRMYREVLHTVFRNEAVRERLGEDVRARTLRRMARYNKSIPVGTAAAADIAPVQLQGAFAAPFTSVVAPYYRYASFLPFTPAYRPTREAWFKYFQPRRLQLSFYVEGSLGGGVVTAEVEQALRGEYDDVTACVLDLLTSGEQLIVQPHYDVLKESTSRVIDAKDEPKGYSTERDLLSKKVRKA